MNSSASPSVSSRRSSRRKKSARLCRRYHLRHQQRVRLRLPARQHGVQPPGKNQRELNFAVIDEVDSILIDEARTPLIISGRAEDSSKLYQQINQLIPRLKQHIEEEEGVVTQEEHFVDRPSGRTERNGHRCIEELRTACCRCAKASATTARALRARKLAGAAGGPIPKPNSSRSTTCPWWSSRQQAAGAQGLQ